MKKSTKIILYSLIIVAVLIGLVIYTFVKNDNLLQIFIGSSNKEINMENYAGTVVLSNDKVKFCLVMNNYNKLTNILFLEQKSVDSLYNKNIEGKDITDAMLDIVENLNNEKILLNNTELTLTSLDNKTLANEVLSGINKATVIYGLQITPNVVESNLIEFAKNMNIKVTSPKKIIKALYEYSGEVSMGEHSSKIDYKISAQNIYNSLIKYMNGNIKIENQNKYQGLDITTLNGSSDYGIGVFPNSNSWYYIENSKITANISFNDNAEEVTYCIKESLANLTEGMCQ